MASNPFRGKLQLLNDILPEKDKKKLGEDMLNPQPNPERGKFFEEYREIYKQHKKFQLEHLIDREVEDRASLPEED